MESGIKAKVSTVQKYLSNRKWRLTEGKLYKIIDKQARDIFFRPNVFQKKLLGGLWYLNVILKARQLGMSTMVLLFGLDYCLFNDNISFGVVDKSLDDAKKKLEKIKHAYDNIPEEYRPFVPKLVTDNKNELRFDNGSVIYVGTSHRGGTLNILWVSEHAIIGKKYPEKEREIRTGALNTVQAGQIIFLESTSGGATGDFYSICQRAEKMAVSGQNLSELDFKFFFFPWWDSEEYELDCAEDYVFSPEMDEYFEILEGSIRAKLSRNKRYWYLKKKEMLGEDIKKEYPGTSKEAFESTDRDKYWAKEVDKARAENRICEFPVEEGILIDTWWDLGRSDYTSVIFTQRIGKEVRIVDFFEDSDEHILYYADILKRKKYLYGKCWLPHDGLAKTVNAPKNSYQYLQDAGFDCEIVARTGLSEGQNEARRIFKSCWFRKSTTEKLIEHLENYRRKWVESANDYIGEVHDEHSHAAAAFRYMAMGMPEGESLKDPKPEEFSDLGTPLGVRHEETDNPFGL